MTENKFEFLQKVINYIDDNLKETLTLNELSANTNITKFHLSRIFKSLTNYSPVEYIRRRKLSDSINLLLDTDLKIIDIAFEYGFQYEQTYIRAFTNLFNISPDRFRNERPTLEITEKYDLSRTKFVCDNGIIVVPTFILKPEFKLIGIKYLLDLKENLVSKKMTKYAYDFYYNKRPMIKNQKYNNEYWGNISRSGCRENFRYYTASVEVNSLSEIPDDMVGATIPSRKYAVFKYIGLHSPEQITISHIRCIYDYIFSQWIGASNYLIVDPFYFENINLNICLDDYCELNIYIPVVSKNS